VCDGMSDVLIGVLFGILIGRVFEIWVTHRKDKDD